MAGHSHWAGIKHKKALIDNRRGKLWSKLSKGLIVAAKAGGSDPAQNLRLRYAIIDAKAGNMPKDTIERAVAKGISADAASLESITYETYGPGGAAILIEALTDSRNRTAQEIKHLLTENGLTLAAPGSAMWAFEKSIEEGYVPKTTVPLSDTDSAKLMEVLEKIDAHDDVENVYTNAA